MNDFLQCKTCKLLNEKTDCLPRVGLYICG